jgi:hypothetical protein
LTISDHPQMIYHKLFLEPFSDTVNMTNIQCRLNKNFADSSSNKKNYQLKNINCTKEINGDLRVTRDKCSNNDGVVIDIGFKLNQQEFVTLFNVCYNNKTASAIYATHYINGKAIKCECFIRKLKIVKF